MKRINFYLPDQTHKGLKEIALEHKISIPELIRRAVDRAYGEDIEDIRIGEEELAKYLANPDSAVDFKKYMRQRRAGR